MSGLYSNFVTQYGLGNIDLETDSIKAVPVLDTYVFSASDVYLSEVSSDIISPAVSIGGVRSVSADDVFDTSEDSFEFLSVTGGGDIVAFLLYKDTGDEATSELISYHSEDFNGVEKNANGGDLEWIKNTSGFFQVTPENVYEGRVASFSYVRVAYPSDLNYRS